MRKADIIGACGGKGSGKTHWILHAAKKEKQIIRIDLNAQAEMAKGAIECRTKTNLVDALEAMDRRKRNAFWWRGGELYGADDAMQFAARCAMMFRTAILADETETLIPSKFKLDPAVGALIRRGRHVGVPFYWTAQLPTLVHPVLRQNSDKMAFFRGYERNYVEYVYKLMDGVDRNAIKNLNDYSYLLHENGKPWKECKKV